MPSLTTAAGHIQDLGAYISASPSSFHAVQEAARRLDEAGFIGLDELEAWAGAAGSGGVSGGAGKFYVVRDGALIAWVTPAGAGPTTGFNIVCEHSDSQSFKLNPKK
jgi:aspartyl aminopeptidase